MYVLIYIYICVYISYIYTYVYTFLNRASRIEVEYGPYSLIDRGAEMVALLRLHFKGFFAYGWSGSLLFVEVESSLNTARVRISFVRRGRIKGSFVRTQLE